MAARIMADAQAGLFLRPCGRMALVVKGSAEQWDQAVKGGRLLMDCMDYPGTEICQDGNVYFRFLVDDGDPQEDPRTIGRTANLTPRIAEILVVLLVTQANIDLFVHGPEGAMHFMAFLRKSPWEDVAEGFAPVLPREKAAGGEEEDGDMMGDGAAAA